ncbi:hypothetical protein C8J56DRAFT_567361 [Mycena floridula]|nr:hypothetical protein C8J56DRAFT_567361 [Mycena floridula]
MEHANHRHWGEYLPKIKGDCWDNVMVAVNKYDDDMVKDWHNDIDTVLIFAGLFSAVVTAFVIESYQWLSEDPSGKTVRILSQLSGHLGTANISLEEQKPFKVDARTIRINAFWFLSLLLALSAASAGILAKQWLREYRRDAAMSSQQALALRQLRYRSWKAWKVPGIIATLPLLLEFALVLFFGGILDLLLPLDPIVFAMASAVVTVTVLFLVMTTLAPTIYVYWRFFAWSDRNILWHDLNPCAFKSPQSLVVLQALLYPFSFRVLRLPFIINRSTWIGFEGWFLGLPTKFGRSPRPPAYLHRGLRWVVANFGDNVTMVKNIIHCIDSQVTRDLASPEVPLASYVFPLASYVTQWEEYTPDYAMLLYLRSFHDDTEVALFSVELFIRCLEKDIEVPSWLRIPASSLSEAQADRILNATKMKVQSPDFDKYIFQQCLTAFTLLWPHPSPAIHKSIEGLLEVIVRRIEGGCPTGDSGVRGMWFQGKAWSWFHADMTGEFVSSEVFRDLVLWAEQLAKEANPSLWATSGSLGTQGSWNHMSSPESRTNIFSCPR